MEMDLNQLKGFLDQEVDKYNRPEFIPNDPISLPHHFRKKEDIEIAGFLSATLSWGRRETILSKGKDLMGRMGWQPFDFVMNASVSEFKSLDHFVHRTFQADDLLAYTVALRDVYRNRAGLEDLFSVSWLRTQDINQAIHAVREAFFETGHLPRTRKHFPDPLTGSAAKRTHMFLRWMVRSDDKGVDFGIWGQIPSSALYCPLDVHSGRVARQLGLLKRRYDDRLACEELTSNLRLIDPADPVKYDFALFGAGIHKNNNL